MSWLKKKKSIDKIADRVLRRQLHTPVDPDLEWYCPECKAKATHKGGTWIECPTHLLRDDGMTRKLHSVTRYVCQWCEKPININTVKDGMGTCKHCNEWVPVRAFQRDLEKAVLDILKKGD